MILIITNQFYYSESARDVLSVEGLRRIFSYRWSHDRGCYDPGSHRRTTSDSYRPSHERWGPTWNEQFRGAGTPEVGIERDGVSGEPDCSSRAESSRNSSVPTAVLQPVIPAVKGILLSFNLSVINRIAHYISLTWFSPRFKFS